jgi:hypothetical protein
VLEVVTAALSDDDVPEFDLGMRGTSDDPGLANGGSAVLDGGAACGVAYNLPGARAVGLLPLTGTTQYTCTQQQEV